MKVRVQVEGETYIVEIGDLDSRPVQAIVDGEIFAVWPEEVGGVVTTGAAASEPSLSATSPGAPPTASPRRAGVRPSTGQADTITSPLPGDVVIVAVKAGDSVEAGQLLCTIESMKMNNPIRSTRAGVVEAVLVAVGDHIAHGQPLLHLRAETPSAE
jgi:biotin carboxyl carrier protein